VVLTQGWIVLSLIIYSPSSTDRAVNAIRLNVNRSFG
jgi:hypothetical protein